MNVKRFILIGGVLVLIVVGLMLSKHRATQDEPPQKPAIPVAAIQPQAAKSNGVESVVEVSQFPDDPRTEVQLLYKLAKAADFYDFNPEIIYHKNNDRPRMIDLGTPTHGATITRGLVDRAYSYYAGSDTRRKPEAANDWYQCTGKWSKEEAIAKTFKILERLGETSVLAKLYEGRGECESVEFSVLKPDGEQIKVTPFYNVALFDKSGRRIVRVEYRMGTNGLAGLTDWHYWP